MNRVGFRNPIYWYSTVVNQTQSTVLNLLSFNMAPAEVKGTPYDKLIIGPITTVGEMLMGGHWLEMLKVQRQAGTYPSYTAAARHMWQQLGIAGFYKGFFPFGALQGCYKGLPVLFTQDVVKQRLLSDGVDKRSAGVYAGVIAGMVQGFFVAPTQRLKSLIATNPEAGAVSTGVIRQVVEKEGVQTVMKGTTATVFRRGVDWGLRFYGKELFERFLVQRKLRRGESGKLSAAESFAAGIFGGAFSALNQPLDVFVANTQKHRVQPLSAMGVAAELMAEARVKGFFAVFYRGVAMRCIHSSCALDMRARPIRPNSPKSGLAQSHDTRISVRYPSYRRPHGLDGGPGRVHFGSLAGTEGAEGPARSIG